jgi:hypothetical protein
VLVEHLNGLWLNGDEANYIEPGVDETWQLILNDGLLVSSENVVLATANFQPSYYVVNHGTGSNYVMTETSTEITHDTTNSAVTLAQAGTYKLSGMMVTFYNGAQFQGGDVVTIKLRRTNNTPADLVNSQVVVSALIGSTQSAFDGGRQVSLPHVVYTTENTDDRIALFVAVNDAPGQGTLEVNQDHIFAERLA